MADVTIPTIQETARICEEALVGALDPQGAGIVDLEAGSDNAALVSMFAQGTARLGQYVAVRVAARDIDTAADTDLDDVLRDRWKGETRKGATAAIGTIYLQRSGTAATSIPLGATFGAKATDTQDAVQYSANATLPVAFGVLKVAVPVTCTATGEAGNTKLVNITDILQPLPDATWAAYVPAPGDSVLAGAATPDVIGGGASAETDAEAKARVKQFSPDATPGTIDGLTKGALGVGGIAFVDVIEPFDGTMIVYAGDKNFQLPAALKAQLVTALQKWRSGGCPVIVRGYAVTTVVVQLDVYMSKAVAGFDRASIISAATSLTKSYFANRVRSDEYFVGGISKAGYSASDDGDVQDVVVTTTPSGDQRRPADSGYGSTTALTRFVVDDTSINVILHDPLTS